MSLQWFFCWSASLDGGARLGTYRDVELSRHHPLAEALGELTRERLFQRVLLRGLAQQDVGRFVELVAGIAPPQGMVEAVYRQEILNSLQTPARFCGPAPDRIHCWYTRQGGTHNRRYGLPTRQ